MGLRKFSFNPLGPPFDEVEQDILTVPTDPTTGTPGVLYMVSGDPTNLWYFLNGNRYLLTATQTNYIPPAGGRTYGILLAIPIT